MNAMAWKRTLVEHHTPPARSATVLPMRGLCPDPDEVTDYDRSNMTLYTWLLIGHEDGMNLEELAAEVFHFDLSTNRAWALRVTLSHLRRAQWVHDRLYPTIS